jgi:hypothetical protein
MHRVIGLFLTAFVATVTTLAQVSAKHVEEPPKQLSGERFKSPMSLEFPLAVADRSMWGVGRCGATASRNTSAMAFRTATSRLRRTSLAAERC